eukprot:jgi/Hompol1/2577/HPOL_006057-RA
MSAPPKLVAAAKKPVSNAPGAHNQPLTQASNAVRVPAGLTKQKLKAVRNMLNIDRQHKRFDGNHDQIGDDNDATPMPARSKKAAVSVSNDENQEPQILHTQVFLEDHPRETLSKSQLRRMRQRLAKAAKDTLALTGQQAAAEDNADRSANLDENQQDDSETYQASKQRKIDAEAELGQLVDFGDDQPQPHHNHQTQTHSAVLQTPSEADVDYESLPPLQGLPEPGMIIAFKMIEMSAVYTPELSNFKEAQVMVVDAVSNHATLKLLPKSLRSSSAVMPHGDAAWGRENRTRFQLPTDDVSMEEDDNQTQEMVHIELSSLLHVKIISN